MVKLKSQERKALAKWTMELRCTQLWRSLESRYFLNLLGCDRLFKYFITAYPYTSGKVPRLHFTGEETEQGVEIICLNVSRLSNLPDKKVGVETHICVNLKIEILPGVKVTGTLWRARCHWVMGLRPREYKFQTRESQGRDVIGSCAPTPHTKPPLASWKVRPIPSQTLLGIQIPWTSIKSADCGWIDLEWGLKFCEFWDSLWDSQMLLVLDHTLCSKVAEGHSVFSSSIPRLSSSKIHKNEGGQPRLSSWRRHNGCRYSLLNILLCAGIILRTLLYNHL